MFHRFTGFKGPLIFTKLAISGFLIFLFQVLNAQGTHSNDQKGSSNPALDAKKVQAKKVDLAFLGSQKSYKLFTYLEKNRDILKTLLEKDKDIPGFFRFKDPDYVSNLHPCLKDLLVMDGYRIEGFACVNSGVKDEIPIDKCKMFTVAYRPLNPGLPPIIAVKGSSTKDDWIHNIKSRGADYMSELFSPLNPLTGVAKKIKDKTGEWVKDTYENLFHDNSLNFAEYTKALNKFAAHFPGTRLLFTGHSLGGSLASNFADAYTKSRPKNDPVQVDLFTFNSLAPSETLKYFHKQKDMHSAKAETVNPNINGYNFITYDDPLNLYNRYMNGTFYGQSIYLSSNRNTDEYGRTNRPIIEGHLMDSIAKDIDFTRRRKEAIEFLSTAKANLTVDPVTKQSKAEEVPRTYSTSHMWANGGVGSSREGFDNQRDAERRYYADHVQPSNRGREIVPKLLKYAEDEHTVWALGSPQPIGTFETKDQKSRKTKVIYDVDEPSSLSTRKKGCETYKL
jgi:hypothetical protein